MNFKGRNVVVVGAGKSGLAAARLCVARGARVTMNDRKSAAELGPIASDARASGIELALGDHPESLFSAADLIVLSPGVPSLPVVERAEARGVQVLPEVDLAAPFLSGRVVGVTGSNGKSTVTTLIGQMCEAAGLPTFTGGNLGDALSLAVDTPAAQPGGVVVAELSSFQLERSEALRCDIALCLNVTDDHLDRHGTFAAYAGAKGRIFLSQRASDHSIVRAGDALCESMARAGKARPWTFGVERGDVRVVDGAIVDVESGLSVPVSELRIRGLHNVENACAAALAARLAGVDVRSITSVLTSFTGLPHRMVLVRELDGVAYYDDSKATNVGATVAAIDGLRSISGKVVLIAGGVDKGGSYGPLRERMAQLGRATVLIGIAAELIERELEGLTTHRAVSLDAAVEVARKLARPGDAVLLAPACASFDMFRSYAHRGDEFQRAVRELRGEI
jgi:UDP-N-acetylmuramoylalanine--D-glutamate ligase